MKNNTTLKAAIKRLLTDYWSSAQFSFYSKTRSFQPSGVEYSEELENQLTAFAYGFDVTLDEMEIHVLDAIRELVVERQRKEKADV